MFQEFVGYLLLPTNKAQRMMIIKGNGGEGKSQIGTVLKNCSVSTPKMAASARFPRISLPVPTWNTFIC